MLIVDFRDFPAELMKEGTNWSSFEVQSGEHQRRDSRGAECPTSRPSCSLVMTPSCMLVRCLIVANSELMQVDIFSDGGWVVWNNHHFLPQPWNTVQDPAEAMHKWRHGGNDGLSWTMKGWYSPNQLTVIYSPFWVVGTRTPCRLDMGRSLDTTVQHNVWGDNTCQFVLAWWEYMGIITAVFRSMCPPASEVDAHDWTGLAAVQKAKGHSFLGWFGEARPERNTAS